MAVRQQQEKSKIVQIWGEELDDGFTIVPNIFLRHRLSLGVKAHHLALIVDIMSFKWDMENPFPSYSMLAARAGVTERGIRKTLWELEKLKLLNRTQRFDEETGVQITTIFDFRPLMQKIKAEASKSEQNQFPEAQKKQKNSGGGEEELKFPLRRNYSSPEEDSPKGKDKDKSKRLKNKDKDSLSMHPEASSILKRQAHAGEEKRKYQENPVKRQKTDFHDSIFKKRLFEVYDNLKDIKSPEELVGEAAYRACKEILVNRSAELGGTIKKISLAEVSQEIRAEFPYAEIPKNKPGARKFFVGAICTLAGEKIASFLTEKGEKTKFTSRTVK